MEPHTPNRLAEGMITSPSKLYLQEVDEPSQVGQVKAPLICFDLDGTVSPSDRALGAPTETDSPPPRSSTRARLTTSSTIPRDNPPVVLTSDLCSSGCSTTRPSMSRFGPARRRRPLFAASTSWTLVLWVRSSVSCVEGPAQLAAGC